MPPTAESKPRRSGCLILALVVLGLIAAFVIVALVAFQMARRGLDAGSVSCAPLSASERATMTDAWTGSGTLTVEATAKADTSGSDSSTEIWFLQGSAPGIDSEVFVFANEPEGLLIGADAASREFFEWGAAADSDSPAAREARAALNAAPNCLG
ncbi:MAG TPA: hypothetical protein VMS99_02045 [Acidimicrobiia bacterium]|nr:hypothetical protein [Acidimicrobiia bacterium]